MEPRHPSKSDLVQSLERLFGAAGPVILKETTKSWVFCADDTVFKLKKPVRDDLQDLTSLRARHNNTLTEIDLNRRLAPDTYLGAVRVGLLADGQVALDDPRAETVDWLVKMRRLPVERMLDAQIAAAVSRSALAKHIDTLVPLLTDFYRKASATRLTAGELMTVHADQFAMSRDVLMNRRFADMHPRVTRILSKVEAFWPIFRSVLAERFAQGAIVECHGDMRPEHICLTDPPVIYDCLEFNRTLRLCDPFSEIVFLGMECAMLGADWIGPQLAKGLEISLGTVPHPKVMRMYEALHAVVRARLCLAHLLHPAPRTPEKWMPRAMQYLDVAERQIG